MCKSSDCTQGSFVSLDGVCNVSSAVASYGNVSFSPAGPYVCPTVGEQLNVTATFMALSPGGASCSYQTTAVVASTSAPPPPPSPAPEPEPGMNCTVMLDANATGAFDQCLLSVAQLCVKQGGSVDLAPLCGTAVANSTVSWLVGGVSATTVTCPMLGYPLDITATVRTNTVRLGVVGHVAMLFVRAAVFDLRTFPCS